MIRLRRPRWGTIWPVLLTLWACSDATGPADELDLLDRLNALPGVTAREIPPHYGYPRAFEIDVTQPVDHHDPGGATFAQRAYLSHVDESMPMVFGTQGYGAGPESSQELAGILQTNGLYVVHRYFPDARPTPPDWRHLDIWQAASDHHRIVELFREIYPGRWISSGVSKGGKTALIHKRFYPDDVDATVAYVAPFMFSTEDERFVPYVASLGTAEEREAVHAFQRRLLEHREALLPSFQEWFAANGHELSLAPGPVFEGRVRSYEWNFWQRHDFDYRAIPGPDDPYDEWIAHLAAVTRLQFQSDSYRDYFTAYIYQVYTQTGSGAIDDSHLRDLYAYAPLSVEDRYPLLAGVPMVYDPGAIVDVVQWLQTQGDDIVYIYGEVDPWTAGAVQLFGLTNALKIVQPGADHGVKIMDLDQRDLVLATLGEWLDMGIAPAGVAPIAAAVVDPELDVVRR